MGYPVEMIGPNTALFSIIGSNAIENKKELIFNKHFQELDADCKMMPLNIRDDDLGFFLNGLKDSKIKAVYFEDEYWDKVYSLLPCNDDEINFCKFCDTIDIEDGKYNMRISLGNAIISMLGDVSNKTVMIVGSTKEAKSTLFQLIKYKPAKIILAHKVVEELIEMMHLIPKEIAHDIIRIGDENFKQTCDVTLNFSDTVIQSDIDFNRDFDKILIKISEINTKKWSEQWTI